MAEVRHDAETVFTVGSGGTKPATVRPEAACSARWCCCRTLSEKWLQQSLPPATVSLVWDAGRRVSTIPKDGILQVTGCAPQGDEIISIVWRTEQDVIMFAVV